MINHGYDIDIGEDVIQSEEELDLVDVDDVIPLNTHQPKLEKLKLTALLIASSNTKFLNSYGIAFEDMISKNYGELFVVLPKEGDETPKKVIHGGSDKEQVINCTVEEVENEMISTWSMVMANVWRECDKERVNMILCGEIAKFIDSKYIEICHERELELYPTLDRTKSNDIHGDYANRGKIARMANYEVLFGINGNKDKHPWRWDVEGCQI